MKNYIGLAALGVMVSIGAYMIYQSLKSNVKEATPEAKFNRNINFIYNG